MNKKHFKSHFKSSTNLKENCPAQVHNLGHLDSGLYLLCRWNNLYPSTLNRVKFSKQQNPFKKAQKGKKPQRTAEEGSFLYDGCNRVQNSEFGIREDTQLFWQVSFDENLLRIWKEHGAECGDMCMYTCDWRVFLPSARFCSPPSPKAFCYRSH